MGLLEPGIHVNPDQGNKNVWAKMLTAQWKLGKLICKRFLDSKSTGADDIPPRIAESDFNSTWLLQMFLPAEKGNANQSSSFVGWMQKLRGIAAIIRNSRTSSVSGAHWFSDKARHTDGQTIMRPHYTC